MIRRLVMVVLTTCHHMVTFEGLESEVAKEMQLGGVCEDHIHLPLGFHDMSRDEPLISEPWRPFLCSSEKSLTAAECSQIRNHPFWGVFPLFLVQHPYMTQ